MDIFLAVRELLHEIYPLPVYAGMFVAFMAALRLMPQARKMTLFVWFFSFPITLFMLVFYIKGWPPIPLARYGFIAHGILLAQFGWLGASFSVAGWFTNSKRISSAAFWISALPVSLHIAYLSLSLVSGTST